MEQVLREEVRELDGVWAEEAWVAVEAPGRDGDAWVVSASGPAGHVYAQTAERKFRISVPHRATRSNARDADRQ